VHQDVDNNNMLITESNITFKQMRIYAYHGVNPQERLTGAYFYIDLTISVDFQKALESDNLKDTINYAELYHCIKEEMAIPSQLLEHAAGRIAKRLFDNFPTIKNIKLTLTKENPPMGADIQHTGVEISAKR
jgi:dihydroneopterin aldolase